VARTKEYFACANHGLVLFDYDESEHTPEHLRCRSPGALMRLLARIPELDGLQFHGLPSSSAGITNAETGEAYHGHGMHVYVETESLDLAKLRQWAEVKCWEAGLGYIAYAANGALLVRYVIDLAVLSAERLIFEALPHLGPGLVHRRHRGRRHQQDGTPERGGRPLRHQQVPGAADHREVHRFRPQPPSLDLQAD
jgi:hypothetical protein